MWARTSPTGRPTRSSSPPNEASFVGTPAQCGRWENGLMARGDPPFPLEHLVPYFRGGRFAMIAVRGRCSGVPELDRQIERCVAMSGPLHGRDGRDLPTAATARAGGSRKLMAAYGTSSTGGADRRASRSPSPGRSPPRRPAAGHVTAPHMQRQHLGVGLSQPARQLRRRRRLRRRRLPPRPGSGRTCSTLESTIDPGRGLEGRPGEPEVVPVHDRVQRAAPPAGLKRGGCASLLAVSNAA